MMRFLTVGVLMSAALVLAKPASAQDPALADLLARAADYHAGYAVRVSGATVDENYSLTRLVAGRMETPIRFASDVVLVNVNGRVMGLRDLFSVDNVRLREREARIVNLLTAPTLESWNRAQAHAAEQNFRFLFDLILQLNDPSIALHFISRDMQPKVTFKIEKQEKLNGIAVTRIGFKENGDGTKPFVLGTKGNAAAAGRFWIENATGAILKTELWATSSNESVVNTVVYAKAAELDLWLPSKMTETYSWKEMDDVASNRGVGAYGQRLSFQTSANYSNPRYSPVDLAKIRR